MHRVYLIPGFFGFANLGDVSYFGHVLRLVEALLAEAGAEGAVHVVPTHPTASLAQRAARLHDTVAATAGPKDALHLVGHSTGGLDARLFTTPGVTLPDARDPAALAARVSTVIGVATPHFGTPTASLLATLAGKQLLQLLSASTLLVVRRGALPVSLFVRLAVTVEALVRMDAAPGVVDELVGSLLGSFTPERRDEVRRFFEAVGDDQRLLTQLTPDAIDAFEAAAPDRPGVFYGDVVTRARAPRLTDSLLAGLDPYAHAEAVQWRALHTLASRMPPRALPPLRAEVAGALGEAYDTPVTASDNDGMVPTLSQCRGRVIAAVQADHLDVIGHYDDPATTPPHYDWIKTGSGFRSLQFELTWRTVVERMLDRPGLAR